MTQKFIRLSLAIGWLILILGGFLVIVAWPRTETVCVSSNPPTCTKRTTYGWPQPLSEISYDGLTFVQENLWFGIFAMLIVSGVTLAVVKLVLEGVKHANSRD